MAGVEHKDLNIENILYKNERMNGGGRYRFQVIDTNRMQIRRCLSMHWRLRNMRRLSCRTPAYLYILHCYAELLRTNTDEVQLKGVVCRLIFEWRRHTKRKIKSIFRRNKHLLKS
ncbi:MULTISPECIES: lipopolysaccharide kinase InaA family protein [Bacteroidales]|uniref:lipopolysaccharide kinase InaA family protein n=1 Tax=Bacteroidales TaxID=171549 RepID=UPI00242D8E2F|nr:MULTISPECIES: lipopolysaccharide kinase InaA family protein [Bacteroidales]